MKLMPKYQSGGGIPPFTIYSPLAMADTSAVQQAQAQQDVLASRKAASSSSSDPTKGQVTDKDLLEMVGKIDGLPNDMQSLVHNLTKFYTMKNLFNNGQVNTTSLSTQYLSALYQVKNAAFNKKEYDKAYDEANKNGGLSEAAITDQGKVVVADKNGNLQQLSIQQYLKNQDKYQAMTNSNLLYLRAHSDKYTNDNSILGVVENGIGLAEVTKMIQDQIGSLGSDKESMSGYSSVQNGKIVAGAKVLAQAAGNSMTVDGLYKNKLITSDQLDQAKLALDYIYKMLPNNAKALLKIRGGDADNPDRGAVNLLSSLIGSRLTNDKEIDVDLQADLNPDGSKKDSKSSKKGDDSYNTNPIYSIVSGQGGENTRYEINLGNNRKFGIDAINYNPQDMSSHEGLGTMTLGRMLQKSGLSNQVSKKAAIQFGSQVLSDDQINNLIYREGGLTRVILPTKQDGDTKVVDFDLLKNPKYQKVFDEINQYAGDPQKQGQILRANGLGNLVDPNTNEPDLNSWGLYLVGDAYGTTQTGRINSSDSMLQDVSDKPNIYNTLNAARKVGLTKEEAAQVPDLDEKQWWSLGDWSFADSTWDKVLEGTVFIPLSNNALQALQSAGTTVTVDEARGIQQRYDTLSDYQKMQQLSHAGTTSSDIL